MPQVAYVSYSQSHDPQPGTAGHHHHSFFSLKFAPLMPFMLMVVLSFTPLVPAGSSWFQLGSSLVPAWFQLVPAWFQLGSSWVPAVSSLVPAEFEFGSWGPAGFQLGSSWFQLGSSLVPAGFQLGSSWAPASTSTSTRSHHIFTFLAKPNLSA